ncbi:putative toxin-antitoxin system toxin component, PIN family [Roseibacillus ishigakijimensis]|uniref:Toxin-antitoxin system toxin component, PIN family n=1 Tax=Roseibacillus ishigakijimensis TaxID=454146 RepID=A0A934RN36_9BACT|nr:putative toxin-antitoxin system toxin component, PIN family [Roseibacillus ishigakijimensis]
MRVVIDTNVIVSGLRSQKGAAFLLLKEVRQGRLTPVISPALFFEYEAVLTRPGILPTQFSRTDITKFLDAFLSLSDLQEIHFKWRPWLRDPNDEFVLELAVAAGSLPIITQNLKDFRSSSLLGVTVMTPWERLCKINLNNS